MRLKRTAGVVLAALALLVGHIQPAKAAGQDQLLLAVNAARVQHGLAPVAISPRLHRAAIHHSDDMLVRRYFSHVSPSGVGLYRRILETGFPAGHSWRAGETLARGYTTASEVVSAWLHSPEHRAILLGRWQYIGAGRASSRDGRVYWTADWGSR